MKIAALGLKAGLSDDMEKSAFLGAALAAVKPLLGTVGKGITGLAGKYAPRVGNALMAGAPARAEGLASRALAGGHGDLAFKKTLGGLNNAVDNRHALIGAGAAGVGAMGLNHLANGAPAEEKLAGILEGIGGAVGSGAKALSPALNSSLGGGVASRAAAIVEQSKAQSLSRALAQKALAGRNAQLGAGALGAAGGGLLAAHAGGFNDYPVEHMPLDAGI